jgi:hypothetical protein
VSATDGEVWTKGGGGRESPKRWAFPGVWGAEAANKQTRPTGNPWGGGGGIAKIALYGALIRPFTLSGTF